MTFRWWLQMAGAVWVGLLLAGATQWLLGKLAPTLWLFALGFLVAFLFDPVLDRLEKKGFSRGQAVGALMAGLLVLVGLLGLWLVPMLVGQTQHLITAWPDYNAELQTGYESFDRTVRTWLNARFPGQDMMALLDAKVAEGQEWLQAKLPGLLGLASDTLLKSVSFVGLLLMVLFIGVNFMLVIDPFRQAIREMLPERAGHDVADIGRQVNQMLAAYVRGQVTMCVVMAVLATRALVSLGAIFGTQYGLIIGALAGLVYLIPWVGATLTNLTAVIFGYVTASHDPVLSALCAFAAMTSINFLCDNILTPRIVGREVGLHPLIIMFSLLSGFQVMGIPGMIVATPLAASVKIIFARWLPLKPVEVKPGEIAPLDFDLGAAFRMARHGVQKVTRKVEGAMHMRGHAEAEDEGTPGDAGKS